jgi:hypothetical protein
MPKTPINYQNGLIYKIVCKDNSIKDLYVGSTTNFKQRKYDHNTRCNSVKPTQHVHQFIIDSGGWDNWDMVLVKYFPCDNKLELLKEERTQYDLLGGTLNKCVPNRSHKEWYLDNKDNVAMYKKEYQQKNKDKIKKYRETNKDKIKETTQAYNKVNREYILMKKKEYRENNKDKIKEYQKEYMENNRDKLREKRKIYLENNKDKTKDKAKEYRDKNRDKINQRDRERYKKNKNKLPDTIN